LAQLKVTLETAALENTIVNVIHVEGREAISQPFAFELDLICQESGDLRSLVGAAASIAFLLDDKELRRVSGMIARVDDPFTVDAASERAFSVLLTPRLHLLSLNERLQVFVDESVPQIVQKVLERGGMKADEDFSIDLQGHYSKREFVVQYKESDLDFISRLTEQVGISFYFRQEDGRDVVHFADEE